MENDSCIVRINPSFGPVKNKTTSRYEVPAAWTKGEDAYVKLLEMDMDAVQDEQIGLITELCDKFIVTDENKPAIANQFIRGDSNTKHIGFGSYAVAKKMWQAEMKKP